MKRIAVASGVDRSGRKAFVFWRSMLLVALFDIATKEWAREQLTLHLPERLMGEFVRLTLSYNTGAAFGLGAGAYSRWILMALTLGAILIIARLYRDANVQDRVRVLSLGLVMGGAVGNLINRIWSERGVVDFIDVGVGGYRWPTFNLADIGVSVGIAMYVWSSWHDDTRSAVRA